MSDESARRQSTGVAERFIRFYEVFVIGVFFAVSVYKQAIVSAITNDDNLKLWWNQAQFYVDNFYYQNFLWKYSIFIFILSMFGNSALRYIFLNEQHGGALNIIFTILLTPFIMIAVVLLCGWIGHFLIPTAGMNPALWVVQ